MCQEPFAARGKSDRMTIIKNGINILTLEDWERHAGPKRQLQWKDGRSAKEAARAWLEQRNLVERKKCQCGL
jgi:hypothetical protein